MRTATNLSVILAVMLLGAVPALAQTPQVTFQVDLNPALEACSFLPESETAFVRGSFDDWGSGQALSDDDSDGVYTTTIEIPTDSTVSYKFYVGKTDGSGDGILGWEDDPNRTYTSTADAEQTIEVTGFNKEINDRCDAEAEDYEIEFVADMQVAILSGVFDPETDVVTVAGNFNGWATTADTLQQDFINNNLYTKVINVEEFAETQLAFKFVLGEPGDASPDGWESIADRIFSLEGLTDTDGDGDLDATVGPLFYNDRTTEDILTEPATVTFEVDLRPAFYHLADSSELPVDTQSGVDAQTSIDGVFINGEIAGASTTDDANDWADWGETLAALTQRQLVDDGTGEDAVAGDSIYTITLSYEPGAPKVPAGKFGINGFDNEGGFGADHRVPLTDGATLRLVYGATLLADGDFSDDLGPGQQNPGDYDPYILIDNSAEPALVTVVRRGGEEDGVNTAVEPVDGELPTAVSLGQNYPNPFNPSTSFEYSLDRSQHVTVQVFDLLGRSVATLVDGVQAANTYRVTFDASNLPSGVYLYQLEAGGQVVTKTMTLLK